MEQVTLPEVKLEGWVKKQITLPKEMSSELAEEIGIHIGDGSLVIRPKYHQYEYYVTLSKEEKEYMKYVCKLIHYLYSIEGKPKESTRDGSLRVRFSSKTLAMWKASLGLPIGRKDAVIIPPTILGSKYILDCLRGIFDTDGSLMFKKREKDVHFYPLIEIVSKSKPLISQIFDIVTKFGFAGHTYLDRKSTMRLYIGGHRSVDLWMDVIGSKSPIHTSKYIIWKKFGFCPPRTTLVDRISILEDKIDPLVFEDAGGEI